MKITPLRLLLALIALGLVIASFRVSCHDKKTAKKNPAAVVEEGIFKKVTKGPIGVTALVASSRDVPWTVKADGKTEASDRYQAKAPSDVKIQKVAVEEGSHVQPGDLLIQFDAERTRLRLNLARNELKEAEAEIANVSNLQKNKETLMQEGKLSDAEADGLDERASLAQAKQERAQSEIDLLDKSSDQQDLTSPFAGVVTKKEVSDGATATADQPLLEVVKLDPIYFSFSAPADSVTALTKEAEVVVRIQGVPQDLTGEISAVGADVESSSPSFSVGGVPVKIKIANPDLLLKSDMRGSVEIRTEARRKIFVLPESAVVRGDKTNYVFKIDGPQVHRVPVELGENFGSQPTVVRGLSEGDTIVATSEDDLRDGSLVEVQATRASEK